MKKKIIGGRYIPKGTRQNLFINTEEDSEEEDGFTLEEFNNEEDSEDEDEDLRNGFISEIETIYNDFTQNLELIHIPNLITNFTDFTEFTAFYRYLDRLQRFNADIQNKFDIISQIRNVRAVNIPKYNSDIRIVNNLINNGIIPSLSQAEIELLIHRAERYQLNNRYIEPLNNLLVAKYMVDNLPYLDTKQGTKRKRSMSTKKKRDIDIDKLIKECERLLKLA